MTATLRIFSQLQKVIR